MRMAIATLHAKRDSPYTWTFVILSGGKSIAELWPTADALASFRIDGQQYRLSEATGGRGTSELSTGNQFQRTARDQTVATARKRSRFARTFEISFGTRRFELVAPSVLFRRMVLRENGAQVGTISPTGIQALSVRIYLPGDLPLEVQIFVFWLAVTTWIRRAGNN